MSSESDDIQPCDLSERVVRDPARPDQKVLRGFALGRSVHDDQWRLYLNAEFTHFLEFDKEAAIHAQEVRHGETLVWVRPDAHVRETSTRKISVEFLQGEIRRGFLRGVSGVNGIMTLSAEGCPCSGCAHCTTSCSGLPGPDNTVGLSCGC